MAIFLVSFHFLFFFLEISNVITPRYLLTNSKNIYAMNAVLYKPLLGEFITIIFIIVVSVIIIIIIIIVAINVIILLYYYHYYHYYHLYYYRLKKK